MSKLNDLMHEMGKTPEEIAAYLRGAQIKGHRRSPCGCPVARLIEKRDVTWPGAKVSYGMVCFNDSQICDYTLPTPVQEFIKRFDEGEWPELELK